MTRHPAIKRIRLVSTIALFLFLGFDTCAQSIKLLRNAAFEVALTDSTGEDSLHIPITVVSDSGPMHLRFVDVTFDNPVRTVPTSAFEAGIETDDAKNAFLKIKIHSKTPLDAGKYHLLFNILKDKAASPPEPFNIDLTVKPATLAPVGTLVVPRIQNYPWGPYEPAYKPLTLFETSRNALVSNVAIRELTLTDQKGAPVSGFVKFPSTSERVHAGKQANFFYKINGDLPIGTVSGNYEINAPQLAAPILFKMDIITRRGGLWIFFLILAGIIFGYVTRIALDRILQLNKARKELLDLQQELQEQKLQKPDVVFGKAVADLLRKLNSSLEKSTADITADIADVKTGLAAANADLDSRLAKVQSAFKAFSDALVGVWDLPLEIKALIAGAGNGLKEVSEAIAANDPQAGEAALQQINQPLAEGLVPETAEMVNRLREAYESIRQSPLKIAAAGSSLSKELDELAQSAAAIPQDKFEEKPENIRQLLLAVSTQRRKTGTLFFDIALTVKSLLETLTTILSNGNINLQNEFFQIREKSAAKFVIQGGGTFDQALVTVEADMKEIQQDIFQALTAPQLDLKADQVKTIREALTDGRYADAANNLVDFKKPAPAVINENFPAFMDAQRISLPLQTLPVPGHHDGFVQLPVAAAERVGSRANTSVDAITLTQVTRTIFWTTLLQTALIGIGMAIFGYPLFAEKFTGTITDMIEIFSWAFVLDFSVNTLTTLAGGVPAKIRS